MSNEPEEEDGIIAPWGLDDPPELPDAGALAAPDAVEGQYGRRDGRMPDDARSEAPYEKPRRYRPGRLPTRDRNGPALRCPSCGYDLNQEARSQAHEILGKAGLNFYEEFKESPLRAVEHFIQALAQHLDILVESRSVKFEFVARLMVEATIAINKPSGDGSQMDAVEMIQRFLNDVSEDDNGPS